MKKERQDMQLNRAGLADKSAWEAKGYALPSFDYETVKKNTKENPFWVHFGVGNIFRAFQCNVVQNLLNAGVLDRGLTVAEGYDYEIIEKMNRPHDDLSILVTLKANGTVEKSVTGSIMESLALDSHDDTQFSRLKEIFAKDSLQMCTFTITEKGYNLNTPDGNFMAAVAEDMKNGPERPESYIGKVAALVYARYVSGKKPIAMVSMDNCSHNGDKLKLAITTFAKEWAKNGVVEEGFVSYTEDENKVSFPWTMIDKITPRPDASIEALLQKDDIEGLDPVITSKNTYVAPFVNAEETEYLVIEDKFPNGRPELEKGGLIFTTRETVDKVEKMKVCTCLNPLHTALAVFGCLMGYTLISEEMKNPSLKKLVEQIGYTEGLPVVVNPGILDPKEFLDTVLNVRIPNPFMPDTPQRIATDTSQKLAIRFGETIKAYAADPKLNVGDLKFIPLVFAGWLRYLMGVDDNGKAFTLSSDPRLQELTAIVSGISLGASTDVEAVLDNVLSDASIWGVDLKALGMDTIVCRYFQELIAGPGAVAAVLNKYTS
jgi:fructuronate reductase